MTILLDDLEAPLETLPFEFHAQPFTRAAETAARLAKMAATTGYVPDASVDQLEQGDEGMVVYAVQRALNATMAHVENRIVADRAYGKSTADAVKAFQERKTLDADGVFGALTSRTMAVALEPKVGALIPAGMLRGLVEGESGGLIGAVNTMVAGGRDVSYCQRRVYEGDYWNQDVVSRAFDPRYQMGLFAARLRDRKDVYFARPAVQTHEWAWRLACLYHNYPSLADKVATYGVEGLSSYYTTPQPWVEAIGAHMDDGTPVRTPLGWGKFYSLGAPEYHHVGRMVEFVTKWIP